MDDIDALAASAYASGTPPTEWAIQITEIVIKTTDDVIAARKTDPAAFPIWGDMPLGRDSVARRIIAALLNAGWTPPTDEQVRDRVAQHHARLQSQADELEAGRVPPSIIETLGYEPDREECLRLAKALRESIPDEDEPR